MELKGHFHKLDKKELTFTAIKIGKVKFKTDNINIKELDIYKTTQDDAVFLDKLNKEINMRKLMPNINHNEANVWQEIFKIGINKIKKDGYMIFENNKPCGLMKISENSNKYKLDIICSIPTEMNKKVPNIGNTFFYLLFDKFLKSNAHRIELDAVTNGPFNAVSKYMKLGFKQTGGENGIIAMKITKENADKSLQTLKEKIHFEYTTPQETDLKLL